MKYLKCNNTNIHGNGLCQKCYSKQYYIDNKEKINECNKNIV